MIQLRIPTTYQPFEGRSTALRLTATEKTPALLFPDNGHANTENFGYRLKMHDDAKTSTGDPRADDVRDAERFDPASGASDDPRVDPTPDKRQSDTETHASITGTRSS
jgi:hypothetical protein